MNTMKSKSQLIKESFDELFNSRTQEEKQKEQEVLLANRFLSEIEKALEAGCNGIGTKKALAKSVGTSASYITQIFRNDRLPNLSLIVKMAEALNLNIDVKMTSKQRIDWLDLDEILSTTKYFSKKFKYAQYNEGNSLIDKEVEYTESAHPEAMAA